MTTYVYDGNRRIVKMQESDGLGQPQPKPYPVAVQEVRGPPILVYDASWMIQ